jgi:hypothetical protein
MNAVRRRNRLLPWYIGIAIVFASVAYVGYHMYVNNCAVTPPTVFLVLLVVPVVYLVLMYLAFTSQE